MAIIRVFGLQVFDFCFKDAYTYYCHIHVLKKLGDSHGKSFHQLFSS